MGTLNNRERLDARRYDCYHRAEEFTKVVYAGGVPNGGGLGEFIASCEPEPSRYHVYFGEMHGHTNLSDAQPDIDDYFKVARDQAKLDFCAISDHDHGGVHSTELWDETKWSRIQEAVKKYNDPHKFTTILAYERDSYPWYNNLVVYFGSHDRKIPRGSVNGEITREELEWFLAQDDLFIVPHTTSTLPSGCDFTKIPLELMTPFVEVYSRWGTEEYFDNPNPANTSCRGGFWQDALKKGARMGCICGSDDHEGTPGLIRSRCTHNNLRYRWPGLTAVLAEDNTLEAIFAALKARRCYGLMGGRITIDFRIDGHYMGEEYRAENRAKDLFFAVDADAPIRRISVVKNCEDIMHFEGDWNHPESYRMNVVDYDWEQPTDVYYLRVELADGRYAWTSPIWVNRPE